MRAIWIGLCLVGLAAASVAQQPVRIVSSLRDGPLRAVQEHLAAALPDLELHFEPLESAELIAKYPDGLDVDLLCGVDVQLCEIAAAAGRLTADQRLPLSIATDPQRHYFAPWAYGWALTTWVGGVEPPATLRELIGPEYGEGLGLCGPRAAPSLWGGWLRALSRDGWGEDEVFGWLLALDARVGVYPPTIGAVQVAFELGETQIAVLPLDRAVELRARTEGVVISVPEEGVVLTPLGIARVARVDASPRAAAAQRVFEALLDAPDLSARMRDEFGLFTRELGDALVVGSGEQLAEWRDRVRPPAPIQPKAAPLMLQRWEVEVRGRGAWSEQLGLILDVAFTLMFFGVIWWLFRGELGKRTVTAATGDSPRGGDDG